MLYNNNIMVKKEQEHKYENVEPIFRVKTQYQSNTVNLVLQGSVKHEEEYGDTQMEFETDKFSKDNFGDNVLYICDMNEYKIVSKMYVCNIGGGYLLKNDKLPVFYLSIMYERKFCTGFICSIFVFFTIDEETKKTLTEPKKYLQKPLNGKFTIEIIFEECDEYIKKFTKFTKENMETSMLSKMVSTDASNISQKIKDEVDGKITTYLKFIDPVTLVQYPHKNIIISKYMKTLCKNPDFIDMLKYTVKMRDHERRATATGCEYKLPKRIFNNKELKGNPNKIDEMLNNADLDRDDDSDEEHYDN